MEPLVGRLADSALKCFASKQDATFEGHLDSLVCLMNSISATDFNFEPEKVLERFSIHNAPVVFIPVCKNETFSIRIFAIRPDSEIPLHDHPGMFGFCKVIHGSIIVKSYTEITDHNVPDKLRDQLCNNQSLVLKCVRLHGDKLINRTDSCILLTPSEGNYHQIKSTGGMAAFVDLLAPPYGREGHRSCHYYECVDQSDDSSQWLSTVPSPSDYCCTRMEYVGPHVE